MEGQYRLVLGGTEHVNVHIRATDILPIPELEPYEILGQFKPGVQLTLRKNSTCSAWIDVVELVSSQDLDIQGPDGEDAHVRFLETMADAKETLPTIGLSWRWMLAAKPDGTGVELQLQGMPSSAASLHSVPSLNRENVACTVLARYTVDCSCFDGKEAAGPVPRFFTSNIDALKKELRENLVLAHGYCQAVAGKLIVPEELTSIECMEYVQGTPRPGKGESPFLREWIPPPTSQPAKKPRVGAGHPGPGGSSTMQLPPDIAQGSNS
jgi:hypothetical protein